MADTFLVQHRTEAPYFSVLQPDSAYATDHPYFKHNCACGIYNTPGSGKVVKIIQCGVANLTTAENTGSVNYRLVRTSAMTGGTPITVVKLDQNNAALNASVSVVKYPATLTASSNLLRQDVTNIPKYLTTNLMPTTPLQGATSGPNTSTWHAILDTNIQPQVLREGEGIAITTSANNANNYCYPIEVTIQFNIGTSTYMVSEIISMSEISPYLGIFNNSGSGVIVNIQRITISEIRQPNPGGTSFLTTIGSIERFEGMDINTGYAPETILPMDTNAPLGSAIVPRVGASVQTYGASSGAVIAKPVWQIKVDPPWGVATAPGTGWPLHCYGPNLKFKSSYRPWTIREGEGIGFFYRYPYCTPTIEFTFLFTVEDNRGPGGSSVWIG